MEPMRSWCRSARSRDECCEARGEGGGQAERGADSFDCEGAGRSPAVGAAAGDWELLQVNAMRGHQGLSPGECGDAVASYEGAGDGGTGQGDARGEVCKLSAAAR